MDLNIRDHKRLHRALASVKKANCSNPNVGAAFYLLHDGLDPEMNLPEWEENVYKYPTLRCYRGLKGSKCGDDDRYYYFDGHFHYPGVDCTGLAGRAYL